MEPNDWRVIGWIWTFIMVLAGAWIISLGFQTTAEGEAIINANEQGAALWWLGTAVLVAAVVETWSRDRNLLILFAGISAAGFGVLGASYTLAAYNPPLLVILFIGAFYSLVFGVMGALVIQMIRWLLRRI